MTMMSMVIMLLLAASAAASSVTTISRERSLADAWSKELAESDIAVANHKNPIKRVVTLLEKMKAELVAESSKEEGMYDKLVCWCETNDKEKAKAIEDTEAKIAELTASLSSTSAKKAQLLADIKLAKKTIITETLSLKEATAIREKAKSEFSADETEMMQYVANLKNAITIMGKHYGEFLQAGSPITASLRAVVQQAALKYDLMLGATRKGARYEAKHSAASLIAVDAKQSASEQLFKAFGGDKDEIPVNLAAKLLAESAKKVPAGGAFMQAAAKAPGYQSYSARSSTIFGILKQMLDEFEAKLSQEQKDELRAEEDFRALTKTKTELIAASKAKLDLMEQESAASGKLSGDDKEELAALTAQRTADLQFTRNLKITCEDLDRKYADRVKTRGEEIKAVAEAISILTEDDNHELMTKTISLVQERSNTDSAAQVRRSRAVSFLWKKAHEPSFADDLLAEWAGRTATKSALPSANSKLATLAVSVQLDSFTKVKEVMDQLVADLKAQQAEEVAFKAECANELGEHKKAFAASSETKSDLEDKIEALDTKMTKLKEEISDAKKAVASTELEVKKAGEVREAESADFQRTVADQSATQEVLQKALAKLKAFYDKQAALVQDDDQSSQKPPGQFDGYKTHSSPVMSLIEQIIGDSKSLVVEATEAEKESQAAYESFVEDSNAVIASLKASISDKTASSAAVKEESVEAKGDLASTVDKLGDLDELKQGLKAKCDWIMKNFNIRQKARQDEIDAIYQAKYILSGKK